MINKSPDIFDRIIALPPLKIFEPFYKKHKVFLLYALFGAITALVSIGSYRLFCVVFKFDELAANPLSWVLAVSVAYITNRKWVFHSLAKTRRAILTEMLGFFSARGLTLIIEELIILIFVTFLQFDGLAVKIAAQAIVILLNYIFSKLLIFRVTKK